MSLNHIVNKEQADKDNLTIFGDELVSFNGVTVSESQALTNPMRLTSSLEDGQNILRCTLENGARPALNNSFQRFYQQLVNVISIPQGVGVQKSLIDTTGSIGSITRPANVLRRGTKLRLIAHGRIESPTGNQQGKFRWYLGTTLLFEGDPITLPNLQNGSFVEIEFNLTVYNIGVAGIALLKAFGTFSFTTSQGTTKTVFLDQENNTTFQTITAEDINLTFEWLSQSVGDILNVHELEISILI